MSINSSRSAVSVLSNERARTKGYAANLDGGDKDCSRIGVLVLPVLVLLLGVTTPVVVIIVLLDRARTADGDDSGLSLPVGFVVMVVGEGCAADADLDGVVVVVDKPDSCSELAFDVVLVGRDWGGVEDAVEEEEEDGDDKAAGSLVSLVGGKNGF